ncbi:Polyketide synthase, enoylreductase [Penicillium expansum]|uniref:Polyketide synthase, enoylreductase n=1 Tax=Penicillium expansum TaxID=27334 RepID=A0A0A2IVC3_PENEN|nr:Polyketide synthase, enoylreductase [Penicillium expansum]KGO47014.1 Polyketide synthase, enoylreductase [Penicillium expansum]KGO59012.1 Polyketide synthase, enoylreductase [Penicillium expansum]KGO69701.1 Polyketide synthase, enoylreductase [Penicillium expansum]
MSKAIYISPIDGKPGKPGQVYYPLSLRTIPKPSPQGGELLVKLTAAALNHRDLFLRQHLYPGVTFDVPLLADGVGTVVGTGPNVPSPEKWQGKRVILTPGAGWKDSPDGPEEATGYRIMGGTKVYDKGTLQEYLTIEYSEVEEAPEHLSDAEAAALPVTGLTGWRALITKAGERNSKDGAAVLVTGIGGGVALMVLQFAVARGAHVFVTSSSQEKIQKAIELGAAGGVSYKEDGWEKKLLGMLPAGKRNFDAIIDGAGGDSIEKSVKLLKAGGVLSVYGMTVSPKMPFTMSAVLKNIDVRGSTMGSRKEFKEMIEFVNAKKMHPVVSRVLQTELDNLSAIDELFEDMKKGTQFGKLVIEFGRSGNSERILEDSWDEGSFQSFDATHYALQTLNKHIERRLAKVQANTVRLKRELWLLQRHIKEFRHPLFENWEADLLTRLIEVAHAHQHKKLPGGVVIGESSFAERENLNHAYSIAAKGIRMPTLHKLGLSEKYHQALQRYSEVAPYRSPNPFQTEFAFAKWLVEVREDRPELYSFWSKLFPVCYDRTVQESASIF